MQQENQLTESLSWVGVRDPHLKVFDIIMETEFGTTYNAYVLRGKNQTALIETVKLPFFEDFRGKVEAVMPLEKIDILIVNHTEPDHAGSIERLLQINPELNIVGSPAAIQFLKEIVNQDFKSTPVKDRQTLDLGGKTLEFHLLPNLHWPDTMYTLDIEDGVLFSCDSFGSHYCFDGLRLSEVQDEADYQRALKYYYDHILDPYRSFMRKALERTESMKLNLICPGHGPVLDCRLDEIREQMKIWSAEPEIEDKMIIGYVSAYGYTAQLAAAIARGIEKEGWKTQLLDLTVIPATQAVAEITAARGFLLGSPTILSEALPPVWDVLSLMNPVVHGCKAAAVFGSYGWSGEAFPHLNERLKQLRMKVHPEFKVRFKPSSSQLLEAESYGQSWIRELKGMQ